ncbi:MAG: DEAD/DEAH box helicase family protein [Anaerolineales bacterium]|nr:DEAD/DEAH box helicase family protein [Anaerolineales bacterium]
MQTIVALDLETTGLDAERDAVIEIGAVRFQGSRIEDTFHTLINPGRPVPPFVQQLTGINDSMLSNAPRITTVLPDLEKFVGDHPILGHNVAFDVGFLRPRGLFIHNQLLDTFDLASVLIPSAGRYRLDALASALGVLLQERHRALDDATTTHQVYIRLCEKIRELPIPLLEQIVQLGEDIDWGAGWTFEEVLDEYDLDVEQPSSYQPFAKYPEPSGEALVPVEERSPIDSEDLAALLEPGGVFSEKFPNYEYRSQQVTMLRAVADALSSSGHLLVEAGTGIGKSMAYLIPAFEWAASNGERVIISTNTINLQDQLKNKDIPTLNAVLNSNYRGAVLKGRNNYLCPRRFMAMMRLGPRNAVEMRILAKILIWLWQGGTGDRNEINISGLDQVVVWSQLSSETEDCNPESCSMYGEASCPYFLARREAELAHVVIVNHALLLADIATGNRVIPEYNYLIVDEAHHLESATTNGLSFSVTEMQIKRILHDLGATSPGLLQRIEQFGARTLPREHTAPFQRVIHETLELCKTCTTLTGELFQSLDAFLSQQRDDQPVGPYGQQARVQPSSRTLPDWSNVEVAWDNLRQPSISAIESIMDITDALLDSEIDEDGEDLVLALRSTARSLYEIIEQLDQLIFDPDPKMIYWLQVSGNNGRISLHAAPLEIGHLVQQYLWNEKDAIILTSATLATAGDLDYIRKRLNAFDADGLLLGSPFDFETSAMLYLVNDISEPADRMSYQRTFEQGLVQLCKATLGRALVLFTSYEQLRRTSQAITEPLAANGIFVFEQGEGASRHALLESFKTTERAVLLGTRSFWEGVDVPGQALSVLVITRLPFDVPSDPIIAARAETYEMPFDQYTVPEAILRFRQGFGRLIRTKSDRGIVAIFDRRIISKRYGKAFVDSLPYCTMRVGPLSELPEAATRWLGD